MKKIGILRKCFAITVSLSITVSGLELPIAKTPTIVTYAETKAEINTAQVIGIKVAYHTEDEIRDYLQSSGATPNNAVTYKEKPSIKAPYKAGSLTDETLNSALKMVNQVRYIAGISYNVELDDTAIAKTQAASLVNSVNNTLSHSPEKPSGIEDDLYQLGAKGAGSSNLGAGYDTINRSIVQGYMEDGDNYNIDRVGHRRWILNPKMSVTGFGYCEGYTALYAFDFNNKNASEYGVAWPAQTMPIDYFGMQYPWSISMGYEVNIDCVQVELTRISDGRTWCFSKTTSDGYFNVNNDGYGQSGCIIFRPDDIEAYADGDRFQVKVTGLKAPVSYQVSFFDLKPATSNTIKKSATNISKLTSKKKGQITVTYQKNKKVSGYEIVYATNEKFNKSKKKLVSKATSTKVTLSGLKAGQIYYIKVRSYVLKDDKKIYGAYGNSSYTQVME